MGILLEIINRYGEALTVTQIIAFTAFALSQALTAIDKIITWYERQRNK